MIRDKTYTPCYILVPWFFTFYPIQWQFFSTYYIPAKIKIKKKNGEKTIKAKWLTFFIHFHYVPWTSDLFLWGPPFIYTVEPMYIIKENYESFELLSKRKRTQRKVYDILQSGSQRVGLRYFYQTSEA